MTTFAYIFNTRKATGCVCLPSFLARIVRHFLPRHFDIGTYSDAHPRYVF